MRTYNIYYYTRVSDIIWLYRIILGYTAYDIGVCGHTTEAFLSAIELFPIRISRITDANASRM